MSANEFSRIIALAEIDAEATTHDLRADAQERQALAARFSLLSLATLDAEARVERVGAARFDLTMRLRAEAEQACVVTGQAVPFHLLSTITRPLSLVPVEAPREDELVETDLPDYLPEGTVDLGEIAAEELALALDPYPRAKHADTVLAQYQPADNDDAEDNPFAALERLKH